MMAVCLCVVLAGLCMASCQGGKNGLVFERTEGGDAYYLKSADGTSGAVVIPAEYNGAPVVGIAGKAFYGNKRVTAVTIPDGVTTIGDSAFENCIALTTVNLPASLSEIGWGAFKSCEKLAAVTFPDGLKRIGDEAFRFCDGLGTVTIPAGVEQFGTEVFGGCSTLTSVTVEEGVTEIGAAAFQNCEQLTDVTLPDSLIAIAAGAFSGDRMLGTFVVPAGVKVIGDGAFSGCTSLTALTVGEAVEQIGNQAFFECTALYEVILPDSVTTIGEEAFRSCYSLIRLTFGRGVGKVMRRAFSGCESITKVTLDLAAWCGITFEDEYANPLRYARTMAFDGQEWSDQIDLVIPDGVTAVRAYAFYGFSPLKTVTFSDSVQVIGGNAFSQCRHLETVQVGTGLTSVGTAFRGCDKLRYTNGDNGAKFLGSKSNSFAVLIDGSDVTGAYTVPRGTQVIADLAFDSSELQSITFAGNQIRAIGWAAFQDCKRLTQITLPDSVVRIGEGAFQGCTGLEQVTFGSGLTDIGKNVFSGCKGLKSVGFRAAEGWCCGDTPLTLTDPAANVTLLTKTYRDQPWHRGV